MANNLKKRINIRVDDATFKLLENLASKRGESISSVARRILSSNLQQEVALSAQDVLISTMRKAIKQELKQTENRLASLSAKSAISAATSENLSSYLLKLLNEPNVTGVRDACRKRAVAYIREPLEQITGDA
jgi:uncharacterized protein (DUF1778 family)